MVVEEEEERRRRVELLVAIIPSYSRLSFSKVEHGTEAVSSCTTLATR